jgi:hypothetical protein
LISLPSVIFHRAILAQVQSAVKKLQMVSEKVDPPEDMVYTFSADFGRR